MEPGGSLRASGRDLWVRCPQPSWDDFLMGVSMHPCQAVQSPHLSLPSRSPSPSRSSGLGARMWVSLAASVAAAAAGACSHGRSLLGLSCAPLGEAGSRVKPFLLPTPCLRLVPLPNNVLELLLWKPQLAQRLCRLWVTGQGSSRGSWPTSQRGLSWFTATATPTAGVCKPIT